MAEIRISGKKILRTINREFQEQFPYLGILFFTQEEWEKAANGGNIKPIDSMAKLVDVRQTSPERNGLEISIHGNTLVKNLEANFLNAYGLYAKVFYQKGGCFYYTSDDQDEMNLTALNRLLEGNCYTKNPGKEATV